jgi:hypothetical protein
MIAGPDPCVRDPFPEFRVAVDEVDRRLQASEEVAKIIQRLQPGERLVVTRCKNGASMLFEVVIASDDENGDWWTSPRRDGRANPRSTAYNG